VHSKADEQIIRPTSPRCAGVVVGRNLFSLPLQVAEAISGYLVKAQKLVMVPDSLSLKCL
jgi:hypothetical protein